MKAPIYVRFSPRRGAETCESLAFQEDCVRRYFEFAKIEAGPVIQDRETSARLVPLAKREGGAELVRLTTGKAPEYSVVGVYRLDRLFRDVRDGISCLADWRAAGTAVHFAAEGGQSINTATATGRYLVHILLSTAAFEPDLTAERTKAAMLRHQANGRAMSAEPPIGKMRVGRELVDNPQELEAVRIILEQRQAGKGYREIARELTASGPAPRKGETWSHTTVRSVCKRINSAANIAIDSRRVGKC